MKLKLMTINIEVIPSIFEEVTASNIGVIFNPLKFELPIELMKEFSDISHTYLNIYTPYSLGKLYEIPV